MKTLKIVKNSSTPSTAFQLKDINLTVPDIPGKKFVMMLHDAQVYGFPRQLIDGFNRPVPAVVNKEWGLLTKYNDNVYDYVEMPDVWAQFLYDLWDWSTDYRLPRGRIESYYTTPSNTGTFANATPGSMMWVYVNMIEKSRSHTDSYAPEVGARDIVTGRNLDNPKRYEWLFRPCAGQLAMVKADRGTLWELEALDVLKNPPLISTMEISPWLYGWATEQSTVGLPPKPYAKWVVSNYPQNEVAFRVNGWTEKPGLPIPLMSKGGSILIKKNACVELAPNAHYSPYIPAK